MRKQTILLLVLGVLTPILALAQAKVTARLDSTSIQVGSQCRLVVEVSARQGARILWPTLKDHHLSKEIEVVGQRTEGDNEEGQSTMRKVYTLTAWDEGRQTVPALTVDVDGKKYKTQAIALEVLTVKTDSIRPDDPKPPYDIQELPFSQEEWTPIYLWSLLALLLILLALLGKKKVRFETSGGTELEGVSVKQILRQEPPHQKALRRINEIKAARLEGGDDQKEYYTLLTEALRRYMSERFGFNAMEMTSQEIVQRLKADQDPTKIDELRELFATADLVKFARFAADRHIGEMYLANVVRFIEDTKLADTPTEICVEETLSDEDRSKRRRRRGVRIALWLIIAATAAIVAYVACMAYQLL